MSTDDSAFQRGDGGRFVAKELSSERARELQKLSIEAQKENTKEAIGERADSLLRSLGIEGGWEEAPIELRILAEQAVRKGKSSTSSMTLLLEQTRRRIKPKTEKAETTPFGDWNPESGDPCPLCGGNRVTIVLDDESALDLERILNAHS